MNAIENKNSTFIEKLETLNESLKVEIDDAPKSWIDHECFTNSQIEVMEENEAEFFKLLIEKYLDPNSDGDNEHKTKVIEGLRDLRNNCSFYYLILNGFWLLIMFTLNLLKPKMVEKIYFDLRFDKSELPADSDRYEPVSFCYVILFVIVLLMQFVAMVWHRVITFTQVIRKTSLVDSNKELVNVHAKQNGHVNREFEAEEKTPSGKQIIITL